MICYKCKKKGRYANKWPSLRDDDNKKYDTTIVHVRDSEDDEQVSEYSYFSFMTIELNTSSELLLYAQISIPAPYLKRGLYSIIIQLQIFYVKKYVNQYSTR